MLPFPNPKSSHHLDLRENGILFAKLTQFVPINSLLSFDFFNQTQFYLFWFSRGKNINHKNERNNQTDYLLNEKSSSQTYKKGRLMRLLYNET